MIGFGIPDGLVRPRRIGAGAHGSRGMVERLAHRCRGLASAALAVLAFALWAGCAYAQQQPNPNVRPPAGAVINAPPGAGQEPSSSVRLPGGAVGPGVPIESRPGGNFDVDMWTNVRKGLQGQVSIPDKKSGQLIQTDGEVWRSYRNGPLSTYGAWTMGGTLALIALFYLLRGKVRIDGGLSGSTIERFNTIERMGHWLLAVSFIILALTGLNLLYGRYLFRPIVGDAAFANLTMLGKLAHNYVAFAFMVGLVIIFLKWVRHNLLHYTDIVWLAKGGGILIKGVHAPSKKFNFGQKLIFWSVVLGGIAISLTGLALMFPFQFPLFAKTFAWLNLLGTKLPTALTPMQEMQLATTWHAIAALGLICIVLAHIYIGTIGMQGAFSAMGSGQVDVNWAKEHHNLWAAEVLKKAAGPGSGSGAVDPPPERGTKAVPAE